MSIRTVAFLTMICAPMLASRAGATPFAYVGDGTNVDVMDTATNTVVTTVPIGTTCGGVAVSPDGSHVYLACNSSALHVIDTATNTATQSPGGTFTSNPSAIAVHPDGTRVYVVDGPQVRVIDTATLNVVASISDPSLGATTMAINPAGTRLYVGGGNNGVLIVMNLTTNTVVTEIGGLAFTYFTAITPDGAKVYTGRLQGFPIHVIDTATNTLATNIPIPQGVAGLAINPAGTRLYNVSAGSSAMQVIDTATDTVLTTVSLVDGCGGIFPAGIAVNPAGTRAYFYGNGGCDGIAMRAFDTATNTIVGSIPGTSLIAPEGPFIGPFCPGACSDGNPCTDDHCNPVSGACTYTNNTGPCTSDGNPCTDDVCDGTGTCTHPLSAPGSSCDDGTFCNGPDTCDAVGGCTNHSGDPCAGGPECANECDEEAQDCFDSLGTACTDDGNECTLDQCNGAGACVHPAQPDETPCDDANACTSGDQCIGGVCVGTPGTCGDSTLQPGCGEQCDDGAANGTPDSCCTATCQFRPAGSTCHEDGNFCTNDLCDAGGTCTHAFGPAPTCATPTVAGGAQLKMATKPGPGVDQVKFKWSKGPIVQTADFGAPGSGTFYQLCVYQGDDTIAYQGQPAGGVCGIVPCWKQLPTGWKFKSVTGTPDGITGVALKAGTVPLKAKIQVKAKGVLSIVEPPLVTAPNAVVAQLRTSAGSCWGATFTTPTKNLAGQFLGKSN